MEKDLFNLKFQLIVGLILSILFLIIIPIVVVSFEKNSIISMVITSILIFIMGFINALLTSGFYSLASFFPTEMVVSLNTGMAIAGILMNVIQYLVLFLVDTGDKEKDSIISALSFFIISGFVLLICLIILLSQFKTKYYKYYLRSLYIDTNNGNSKNMNDKTKLDSNNNDESNEEHIEMTFKEMFKILKDIDLLSCYIYIITASVYPNAVISQNLYNMDEKYMVNTILIIINTCDTIGRYLVIKVKPSKKLTYIVVLSRTILLITILLNYYLQQGEHTELFRSIRFTGTFLLINIICLAISNGVGTSLVFGIAPTLVDDKYKGQAGASISFFATFGTFSGTILAFLTGYIMNLMKEN